jgi:hypothetical protein
VGASPSGATRARGKVGGGAGSGGKGAERTSHAAAGGGNQGGGEGRTATAQMPSTHATRPAGDTGGGWWHRCMEAVRGWWRGQGGGTATRAELLGHLAGAAAGRPAEGRSRGVLPPAVAARVVGSLATRAGLTEVGAARALRRIHDYVELNEAILEGTTGPPSPRHWDEVLEAAMVALADAGVDGDAGPRGWRTPGGRPQSWPAAPLAASAAAREVATARARIEALGYCGGPWPLLAAQVRAIGAQDPEDRQKMSAPIFAWQVGPGGPRRVREPWVSCAWAMAALLATAGGRIGKVGTLTLGGVSEVVGDTVTVRFEGWHKDQRRRGTRRVRRTRRALTMANWRLEAYLRPWLTWRRANARSPDELLFPSMVRRARARAVSPLGRLIEGDLWLEPQRPWSSDQMRQAWPQVLTGPTEGRTSHGFRGGGMCEMERGGVDPVVRRRLQMRSLRSLLGSEASYSEAWVDDITTASRRLGSIRVVQMEAGLAVVATSASAGAHDDWVRVVAPPIVVLPPVVDSSDDEAAAAFPCGRCPARVEEDDPEGFLCDEARCTWGVCARCHTRPDLPLRCPRHSGPHGGRM